MKGSILKGFAGLGARFALLSLILGAAGPAYAGQSGAPPPSTNAAAPAAAPATAAPAAKPAAPAGHAVSAGEPAAKGNQEGIKIHGHWTIEVKNPDGKLVTHREFENSLAPSGSGASLLAAFLGGVATPGSWVVQVRDLATDTTIGSNYIFLVTDDTPPAAITCVSVSFGGATCATNLSVTGPTLNPQVGSTPASFTGTTLTLSGSAQIPQTFTAASVGYVETDIWPCFASVTPQTCTFSPNNETPPNTTIGNFPFTERNLDGLNGDPAAVPVTVGQIVNITVVISFQ